ncbi:hypothetical protein Pint_25358 [Pistacia integerrima]|uniref:Uncharacterized protein n=1 Tax=Pistacia integerrima TaxID=434235 RepID=A0ACC0YF94_9ROSI|nr:hypothetical protein Pint_25358 [Pistacia integerrima]
MDTSIVLSEECISQIISLTSPRDACKVSEVSPVFKSAADARSYCPLDYQEILSNLVSSSELFHCPRGIFFSTFARTTSSSKMVLW